eukprot:11323736-Heterocapsa_arctica.AAC.1
MVVDARGPTALVRARGGARQGHQEAGTRRGWPPRRPGKRRSTWRRSSIGLQRMQQIEQLRSATRPGKPGWRAPCRRSTRSRMPRSRPWRLGS